MRAATTAAVLLGIAVLLAAGRDRLPAVRWPAAGPAVERAAPAGAQSEAASGEPVMIVVVGESGGIDALRRSLPKDQIVSNHRDAIALAGGRIFATRVEAASAPLSELGWTQRRVEIIDPAQLRAAALPAAASESGGSAALASKKDLTLQEALALLN